MNIKEIAKEALLEISPATECIADSIEAAEFLRRCLSKMAEQDIEPVAWLTSTKYDWQSLGNGTWCNGTIESQLPLDEYTRLYTEAQLLAARQRTAAWKDAVEDELIICGIMNDSHKDPRKAVKDIALWHSEVAVDPAVSQAARDLQQRTAEACAKVCEKEAVQIIIDGPEERAYNNAVSDCAAAVRYGKWKEYL